MLYRNSNGFFAGPTFDIVDERYADFENIYTIDSYALVGLRTGFSRDTWEVYGEVRNQAAPTDAFLQAGEPRSIYVGARLKF